MHTLHIDNRRPKHTNWRGFGGVYHGYMFQPDSAGRAYTEAQCQTELDRIEAMRLRIARTYYRFDYNWTGDGWNWDSPQMNALSRWCSALAARGVDVALQACWWCPADVNGSRGGSPFSAGTDDWDEMVRRYGRWVSESVHQLIERRGHTNIRYLVLFTEPGYTSGSLPEGKEQWDCWLDCARAAHQQLVADGRRQLVQLVGPNEGSTDHSPMVQWAAERAGDVIDIYSSHNYVQSLTFAYDTYEEWALWMQRGLDNCAATGKPYWFDEYGLANWKPETEIAPQRVRWTRGEYATHMALANCAALNLGVQSTTIWSLLDQQWPDSHADGRDSFVDGEHRCGIAPTLRQSAVPYPGYYGIVLLPRYLGGAGTTTFATRDDRHLRVAAVQTETGDFAVLVVNAERESVAFTAALEAPLGRTLHRHLADPATVVPDARAAVPGVDRVFAAVGTTFSDSLPAGAVAVYTTEAL